MSTNEQSARAEAGVGWYEVIHPTSATTHICYVHEDGSIYFPEGEQVLGREEFILAAAGGRANRLIRESEAHDQRAERLRAAQISAFQGGVESERHRLLARLSDPDSEGHEELVEDAEDAYWDAYDSTPTSDPYASATKRGIRAALAAVAARLAGGEQSPRAACGCDLTGMAPPAVHIVDDHDNLPGGGR